MINIPAKIFTILSGAATVTAIVSTRIYPLVAPYDATMPCVSYRLLGVDRYETQSGPSNLDKYTVRVSIYAATYDDLHSLMEAVIGAMTGMTESTLSRILWTNVSDDAEEAYTVANTTGSATSGVYLAVRNLDFQIFTK